MNDDDDVVSGASGCEAVEELRSSGALERGLAAELGPVRKLLTVCLCGCCPGRLV